MNSAGASQKLVSMRRLQSIFEALVKARHRGVMKRSHCPPLESSTYMHMRFRDFILININFEISNMKKLVPIGIFASSYRDKQYQYKKNHAHQ